MVHTSDDLWIGPIASGDLGGNYTDPLNWSLRRPPTAQESGVIQGTNGAIRSAKVVGTTLDLNTQLQVGRDGEFWSDYAVIHNSGVISIGNGGWTWFGAHDQVDGGGTIIVGDLGGVDFACPVTDQTITFQGPRAGLSLWYDPARGTPTINGMGAGNILNLGVVATACALTSDGHNGDILTLVLNDGSARTIDLHGTPQGQDLTPYIIGDPRGGTSTIELEAGAGNGQGTPGPTRPGARPASPPPISDGPTASPDGTLVTQAGHAITDANGNQWGFDAAGKVTVNGQEDVNTGSVIAVGWQGGQVWQENASHLWWHEVQNNDSWGPDNGTSDNPFGVVSVASNDPGGSSGGNGSGGGQTPAPSSPAPDPASPNPTPSPSGTGSVSGTSTGSVPPSHFLGGTELTVALVYQAAFGRAPDAGGLNYWTVQVNAGLDLHGLCVDFVASLEFTQRFGAPDNASVVLDFYMNVFGRTPDPGGANYWTAQLNQGLDRAGCLAAFATSQENMQLHANIGVIPN